MLTYIIDHQILVTRFISLLQTRPILWPVVNEKHRGELKVNDPDALEEPVQNDAFVADLAQTLYRWVDEVISSNMLWADRPGSHGEILAEVFGLEPNDDDDVYCAMQGLGDDELMTTLNTILSPTELHDYTWLRASTQLKSPSIMVIEVLGDHRILEWEETNKAMLKKKGLWKRTG